MVGKESVFIGYFRLVSALNLAVWQCLLQFLHALVCCVRVGERQPTKMSQSFKVRKSGVRYATLQPHFVLTEQAIARPGNRTGISAAIYLTPRRVAASFRPGRSCSTHSHAGRHHTLIPGIVQYFRNARTVQEGTDQQRGFQPTCLTHELGFSVMATILDRLKTALYAPVEEMTAVLGGRRVRLPTVAIFWAVSLGYGCAAAKHKEVAVE